MNLYKVGANEIILVTWVLMGINSMQKYKRPNQTRLWSRQNQGMWNVTKWLFRIYVSQSLRSKKLESMILHSPFKLICLSPYEQMDSWFFMSGNVLIDANMSFILLVFKQRLVVKMFTTMCHNVFLSYRQQPCLLLLTI